MIMPKQGGFCFEGCHAVVTALQPLAERTECQTGFAKCAIFNRQHNLITFLPGGKNLSGKYFIGIDVSTTASKALVVDEQGTVIASKSYPHQMSTPRPLWSEQDPDEWWQATRSALCDVMKKVPADQVVAIGLTGQMHGLTSLDAQGRPLRPAI